MHIQTKNIDALRQSMLEQIESELTVANTAIRHLTIYTSLAKGTEMEDMSAALIRANILRDELAALDAKMQGHIDGLAEIDKQAETLLAVRNAKDQIEQAS